MLVKTKLASNECTNPIEDWYEKNTIIQRNSSVKGKYERGMLISISNNECQYETIFKSFKELYISLIKCLTGKRLSKWDIKVLIGDWHEARIKLPTRERLLRVIADHTPVMLAGVHNYKKEDIRSKGKEYCHSHFYVYNTHHYLPETNKELRDFEDKIEKYLARYTNTRKRYEGRIRVTPVGQGIHQFTDNVSALKLYDYLQSPITKPQEQNLINYISNNRHLPTIQYPLTTIYSNTKI